MARPGPWLGVIDMQVVFADPRAPWHMPGFSRLIDPIEALITAYSPRVVFTRFVSPAPDAPTGAWKPYYEDWPFALQPPTDPLWDLVPEFVEDAAHTRGIDGSGGTYSATTFSKWGPELAHLLGPEGRLVLCGVSTDCCVLSTALAAADAGVRVDVVTQATTGSTPESTQQALGILALFHPHIRVVSLDEALAGSSRSR
ncbi:MAG: cysteine hydrolase [Micrococcales bacterium]|nr:cysteine hydrolase [Micrococcales bacterium]